MQSAPEGPTTARSSGAVHLVVGPDEHGVTRYALSVLGTVALGGDAVVRVPDAASDTSASEGGLFRGAPRDAARRIVAALADAGVGEQGTVHLHFTDRLLGRTAGDAAEVVEELARHCRLVVTLHDVPQPSDGPEGFPRRAKAYARVVEAARLTVLNSRHEEALLGEALALAGRSGSRGWAVVPLAVEGPPAGEAFAAPEPPEQRQRDVGVLGFLYPGKGHEDALEALASLPSDVGLLALGRPSPGHEDLVDALEERASELGRRCSVTGFVPEEELDTRLREVAVPVAPHRHVSASASIGSWLRAGRRPLVPRGRYVDELEARCPGSLWVYDDLAAACREALADPRGTWLGPGVCVGPTLAEVGEAYAALLVDVS